MTGRAQRRVKNDIEALLEDAEVLQDIDDADLEPVTDPAVSPELEPELEPGLEPGLEPELERGLEPGAEPAPGRTAAGAAGGGRNCRHHRPPPTDASPSQAREPLCVPACAQAIRQTAARDLHLAVSLVVGDPRAAVALTRFSDCEGVETEGALVFGCLLQLAGHIEAAEFWWQYAAGGGNPTAAFCLYLHHRNQGQHWTAQHWRSQARQLQSNDRPPVRLRAPNSVPLLPREVHQAMLAECYRGAPPHLPPAMEAAINSLYAREQGGQDPQAEAYPLPRDAFPASLARAAAR